MTEVWHYDKNTGAVYDENRLRVCQVVSDREDGWLISAAPMMLAKLIEIRDYHTRERDAYAKLQDRAIAGGHDIKAQEYEEDHDHHQQKAEEVAEFIRLVRTGEL